MIWEKISSFIIGVQFAAALISVLKQVEREQERETCVMWAATKPGYKLKTYVAFKPNN